MTLWDAERQIKELLDSAGFAGKRQSKVVLSKDESAALLAESHDASLLVLAVEEHRYELIPCGLSIVLSLLASSAVPLLIIRDGGPFDFSGTYRMLIADDLSVSSLSAVWNGIAFGLASGAGAILHAHVLPPHVRRFAARIHAQDDKLGEDGYMERMERAVETSLRSRSGIDRHREDFERAVCSYRTHVASGKVSEHLEILARDFRPDIIVMGRSASARAFTPRLGRLALNTALSKCRALLMVPPA